MTYTKDDIKKLLLKKLVVFGYFDKASDYGDNNDNQSVMKEFQSLRIKLHS